MKLQEITEYRVETPGSEEMFGYVAFRIMVDYSDFSQTKGSREVILRIAAAHQDKRALNILGMELAYVLSC